MNKNVQSVGYNNQDAFEQPALSSSEANKLIRNTYTVIAPK